jgi:spermidine/putrescine transport system substrate-binding protein
VAFTAASTGRDLLLAGELDVSHNHSGEIEAAIEERPEVRYLVPREGAVVWTDNLVIPAGSENGYTAHVFVNFLLDAGNGARLTETVQYFSPNLASWPFLDPTLRADHEGILAPGVMERLEFIADVGENRRKFDQIWTRVKAGSAR